MTNSYYHPQELCPLIPENLVLGQKQHRQCEEPHQGRQGPLPPRGHTAAEQLPLRCWPRVGGVPGTSPVAEEGMEHWGAS